VDFDGERVYETGGTGVITLKDLANQIMCYNDKALEVVETRTSQVSPPPFMVGIAEIELDQETGHYDLVDYVAVVDCGTSLNPNMTRVQTEGGLGQGIGMAMFEDVTRSPGGRVYENSFMQYRLPSRMDIGRLRVEFENSYEASGPFGAKSIGEIVINTPSPAIAGAIANATGGVHIRELPMTAEKVYAGMGNLEKGKQGKSGEEPGRGAW
jgi:CO/xanthine dehydrogenase Mo-binding subunit